MVEEIRDNLFRIEIPLPQNPLKALNSYFIRGDKRNLLIDTGFNRDECREAMDRALKELDIDMETTDIFITHIHSDHSGLAGYLAGPGTDVYTGEYTRMGLCNPDSMSYFGDMVKQSGLLEMGLSTDLSIHPGYRFRTIQVKNVKVVKDGDIIQVGDYSLQCINTTGHAPDHMCLYEQKHKLLFSGDHILGKITPNNTIWGVPWQIEVDYLAEYFKSLDKINELDIEITLPSHRGIISDCYKRIEELKNHHHNRLQNILDILGQESMTGAQVASKMNWDIDVKTWDQFPLAQKLFASGEALSHLNHLLFKGIVTKRLQDGVVYYQKA
jgi:glyoxylase-like metal-dependent hydrolase (beta-lactamase superfamily II)